MGPKHHAGSFYKLFVHLSWHTKNNALILTHEILKESYAFIHFKCKEIGSTCLITRGVADHIHALVSFPPKLAISVMTHDLKGALSWHINSQTGLGPVYFQDGFGGVTVSPKDVSRVYRYIRDQHLRHPGRGLSQAGD